jgi:hypothetical protein
MNETVVIASLLAVVVFQGVFIFLQKQTHDEIEKDLLNRLMSRNYETYVQAQKLMEPERPLTPDEIYERQQERGIPV